MLTKNIFTLKLRDNQSDNWWELNSEFDGIFFIENNGYRDLTPNGSLNGWEKLNKQAWFQILVAPHALC